MLKGLRGSQNSSARSHLALSARIRVLGPTRVTKGDALYNALKDAVANRTRDILHLTLSFFFL